MISVRMLVLAVPVFALTTAAADEPSAELKPFQGRWIVTELVEDGQTIPQSAIREWLPSGGRAEIIDNAIIFMSPGSTTKQAKLLDVDVTSYPKQLTVSTRERKTGRGVYRFDQGKLVVCLADPEAAPQPKEFSAPEGSKRMLMILERPAKSTTKSNTPGSTKPPAGSPTDEKHSNAALAKRLIGMWKHNDHIGSLFVSLRSDGTFSTTREVPTVRLFHQVFVQSPVSTGKWTVQDGKIRFLVQTSTQWERVNHEYELAIKSLSDTEFVFVDYVGRGGRAVKVAN